MNIIFLRAGSEQCCFAWVFGKRIAFYYTRVGRKRTYLTENTLALVTASKETGLEVIADKTKYIFMSRDQNAGRSHNIKKIYDNSFCTPSVEALIKSQ
jgi:hypothetical protein